METSVRRHFLSSSEVSPVLNYAYQRTASEYFLPATKRRTASCRLLAHMRRAAMSAIRSLSEGKRTNRGPSGIDAVDLLRTCCTSRPLAHFKRHTTMDAMWY